MSWHFSSSCSPDVGCSSYRRNCSTPARATYGRMASLVGCSASPLAPQSALTRFSSPSSHLYAYTRRSKPWHQLGQSIPCLTPARPESRDGAFDWSAPGDPRLGVARRCRTRSGARAAGASVRREARTLARGHGVRCDSGHGSLPFSV